MSSSLHMKKKTGHTYANKQAATMKPPENNGAQDLHTKNRKRPRVLKINTSKLENKKKSQKMDKNCRQHDSVILENSVRESFRVKTPHVILSNQRYNQIKQNAIMLTNPQVQLVPKNRKILYNIKYMGENIHLSKKGRYYNLKPCCTKRNMIYVLVAIHEVMHIENIIFYTEKGDAILQSDLNPNRQGYVLLASIQVAKKWMKNDILITDERYELINKYYINQIKQKQGSYHFGTTGTIFGLGYGPKCHRNKDGHSIDRYSNSEYMFCSVYIASSIISNIPNRTLLLCFHNF